MWRNSSLLWKRQRLRRKTEAFVFRHVHRNYPFVARLAAKTIKQNRNSTSRRVALLIYSSWWSRLIYVQGWSKKKKQKQVHTVVSWSVGSTLLPSGFNLWGQTWWDLLEPFFLCLLKWADVIVWHIPAQHMTATFAKLSASCYSKVMHTSAELLWGSVLFSSGVLWELPGVALSHVAVEQEKHVNTSHTPPSTHSAHSDKAHTDRHTVSPPVNFYCLFASLPPLSPSCHCITEVKKKEKKESLISLHIPLHESQLNFFSSLFRGWKCSWNK